MAEFCGGFPLRTGVLILSWSTLIQNGICSLLILAEIFTVQNDYSDKNISAYFWGYYLGLSLVGMIVSILAILGIQRNKANLLDGILYYFLCNVFSNIGSIILLISPYWTEEDLQDPNFIRSMYFVLSKAELFTICAIGLFFWTALVVYFAFMVRNCRDEILKNTIIVLSDIDSQNRFILNDDFQ